MIIMSFNLFNKIKIFNKIIKVFKNKIKKGSRKYRTILTKSRENNSMLKGLTKRLELTEKDTWIET